MTYAGYLNKAFLGVSQIRKYGNINTSYPGDLPKTQRISAAGGAPNFTSMRCSLYLKISKEKWRCGGAHLAESDVIQHCRVVCSLQCA